MSDPSLSRRGFLAAVAAGTAAAWLASHRSELGAAARIASSSEDDYHVLTAAQVAVLDAATAQLIPTDDTPGAREAKVVRFIDRSLETWMKDERTDFERLLAALQTATVATVPGAASFAALTDAQQVDVLKAFEKSDADEFKQLRELTIIGMVSNPSYGGNFEKAGWKMMGFIDQFAWQPPFGYYDRG